MANIAGSLRTGISDAARVSNTSPGFPLPGAVRVQATTLGGNPPVYKNKGWVGGVPETWISVGSPSFFNPATEHGLSDFTTLQHQVLKQ